MWTPERQTARQFGGFFREAENRQPHERSEMRTPGFSSHDTTQTRGLGGVGLRDGKNLPVFDAKWSEAPQREPLGLTFEPGPLTFLRTPKIFRERFLRR